MDTKWRIGAVSYLNTRPLLWGLERSELMEKIDLIKSYPASIAQDLIEGKIDIGLVPVAIAPLLKEAYFVSDYCIGSEGAVASVCIFSEVPLEQIQKIYLDDQSRTSVQLARILLANYWGKEVQFLKAEEDYVKKIKGTTAGLIIGDRALAARPNFNFIYDLSAAWKDYTGLPFVFATWISNKPIPDSFIKEFDKANGHGLANLQEVIEGISLSEQVYDLQKYYTENISYHLTEEKKKGMNLFLKSLLPVI